MTTVEAVGHVEPFTVHFDDLDAMGIVHNARYAVFLERALSNWWGERGHSYAGGRPTTSDVMHAVAEYSISYRTPVRGTGDIGVHFWLESLGESSAVYRFRIVSADGQTVHAEGRRVNVKLDPRTLRPAPWSDHARSVCQVLIAPPVPAEELEQQG
ncbi:thioesterase family protein [Dactylosporangium sp. NPDC005572]|uniref:acyl-CoA thioesterase n=1 Tax=Dactylosporangium sp. NPDC005572 TaxID=3156889 RepID=UPI0033ADF072